MDDVEIEQVTERAITVLSVAPIPRGERMILWAPTADGGETPLRVRAVQRQVDLAAASLRHRVRFDVDAVAASGRAATAIASDGWRVGGIVRELPVKLLDLSTGGCLVESPVRVAEGAVGWLSVNGGDAQYDEIARVCRSDWRVERFWPCVAGIEFLTLEAPAPAALRRNVALFTTATLESHDRT